MLKIRFASNSELVEKIVGQFAFMKAMSNEEDPNYNELQKISLDDVFKKAMSFFNEFTFFFGAINSKKSDLSNKITQFLKEWETITDVYAIQKNVHYQLKVLDTENSKP